MSGCSHDLDQARTRTVGHMRKRLTAVEAMHQEA